MGLRPAGSGASTLSGPFPTGGCRSSVCRLGRTAQLWGVCMCVLQQPASQNQGKQWELFFGAAGPFRLLRISMDLLAPRTHTHVGCMQFQEADRCSWETSADSLSFSSSLSVETRALPASTDGAGPSLGEGQCHQLCENVVAPRASPIENHPGS